MDCNQGVKGLQSEETGSIKQAGSDVMYDYDICPALYGRVYIKGKNRVTNTRKEGERIIMKKKLFAAAMAGTMVLSLAACGGSKPAETTAAPAAEEKTEAAAEGETKAEAAAESGSAWEPSTTVSIVVPGRCRRKHRPFCSCICSVRKRADRS